jgi:hypothetical protein
LFVLVEANLELLDWLAVTAKAVAGEVWDTKIIIPLLPAIHTRLLLARQGRIRILSAQELLKGAVVPTPPAAHTPAMAAVTGVMAV